MGCVEPSRGGRAVPLELTRGTGVLCEVVSSPSTGGNQAHILKGIPTLSRKVDSILGSG